jgi:hypothetical protein
MASLTNAQRDYLTTLFVGMFNAAPGADYLGALVEVREAGYSLPQIADILASKPQFKELYPATMSAEDAADRIIATLLTDDTSDATKEWAKDWLIEQLTGDENLSLGAVLYKALEALTLTENDNYASAQAQLANKLEVANYYSVKLLQSSTDLDELQTVLKDVTADPDSVDAAKDALDNPGQEPETPPPGDGDPEEPTTPPVVGGTSETKAVNIDAGTPTETVPTTDDKVTLTLKIVQPDPGGNNGTETYTTVTLDSDAKQLTVTLTPATDTDGTPATNDDGLDKVSLSISANGTDYADLVSLTLGGNGKAEITNDDGASLIYIDASGLASKTVDGEVDAALTLTSNNSLQETIKLGSGHDILTLNASTYADMDTVTGLTLVADDDDELDTALSDDISVDGGVTNFVKLEPTSDKLDFAFIQAAQSGDNQIVFQFGGSTYIYSDTGATIDALDDDDFVVKLVGTVDVDLLLDALNG